MTLLEVLKVDAANDVNPHATMKRISSSEWPIYGDPQHEQLEEIPEHVTAFRQQISAGRKWVWNYMDSVTDTTDKIRDKYNTAGNHARGMLTYIQEDSGALPRVGIIAVSGLGGIVFGYRGGILRKAVFSSVGMAAAASVCYPHQAVDIGRDGWQKVRGFASHNYNNIFGSVEDKKASSGATEQGHVVESKHDDKGTKKDVATTAASSAKKDFGMSKAEDKDMYSTRGN